MKYGLWLAGIKFLVFIVVLFTTLILVKKNVPIKEGYTNLKKTTDKKLLYAIGSSRTGKGINDKYYNSISKNTECSNVAGPARTFLFNYILAKKIMQSSPGCDILIELTILNGRFPHNGHQTIPTSVFLREMYLLRKFFTLNHRKNILSPLIENCLSGYLCASNELKQLIGNKTSDNTGFISDDTEYTDSILFHLPRDITYTSKKDKKIELLYVSLINKLITDAAESKTKIIFYLSPAFGSEEELQRLLHIFSLIPVENKITYTHYFLKKLKNNKFFSDASHLNLHGANLLTDYICRNIEK